MYVINDTVSRLLTDGMPITRENVRDYAQQTNLPTLQGVISFDANGDLKDKIISVFQVKDALYKFVGPAPGRRTCTARRHRRAGGWCPS